MEAWTPADRDSFIEKAINSSDYKGNIGPYFYNVYSEVIVNEEEDPRKTQLTKALAKVIYEKYRKISLKFYEILMQKLATHYITSMFINTDICVLIKGGNAYTYLVDVEDLANFPYSDLDIVISINPTLDDDMFEFLSVNVKTIILQTISQYKRMLDHMLFLNKPIENQFMTSDEIENFKSDVIEEVDKIDIGEDKRILTPFDSTEVRNCCSRYSFMLTYSKHHENSILKIDVPHYDKCECIPARKTPIFLSVNDTINFKRDSEESEGHFTLFRIRFNFLAPDVDEDKVIKDQKVTADFIDVVLPAKDDTELIDFWNNKKFMKIRDIPTGLWLQVPTLESCINDLHKMLYVYKCPEGKRAKREAKLSLLKRISER